jgi:hypothetical protein
VELKLADTLLATSDDGNSDPAATRPLSLGLAQLPLILMVNGENEQSIFLWLLLANSHNATSCEEICEEI